jgi:hypothetical protein
MKEKWDKTPITEISTKNGVGKISAATINKKKLSQLDLESQQCE